MLSCISIRKSGVWICGRPVQAEMASRVASDGWVEVPRSARRKDVGNRRYGWCKRIQSGDDVVPGLGEATVSDGMHLVEDVAILCSRILEPVVEGVQKASAACWL